jgi:hypothetical protein
VPSGVTNAASGNATTTTPSSGVYVAVKAVAAANTTGTTSSITGSGTATVSTAGYAPSDLTGSVSVSGTATAKTSEAESLMTYVPITTLTLPTSPTSSITSGYTKVGSNIGRSTSTRYINIAPGYHAKGEYYEISSVANGTISAVASDPGTGYTENTSVVIAAGGWLQMTAGYYGATKISLATLIKDDAGLPNGVASYSDGMLNGVTAYDNNGTLVSGSIATYTGEYTITT